MTAWLLKLLPANFLANALSFILEAVLIVGVTWYLVAHHYALKEAADLAKAQQEAAVQYQAVNKKYNDVSVQLETAKAQKQIVYQTITREVPTIIQRDVYRNVCLDPDGMRLANKALAGAIPASASSAFAAMPPASATGGNDGR